jgi:NAD-dependent dihydropyrimidine dehydrogenase PreA subunit
VAYGIRHCRALHRGEGYRLRRRLPRRLHPPQEEHDLRRRSANIYIDPVESIDCGACVAVCPVSAIFALDDLPEKWKHFTEINASYVQGGKFTPEEYAKHAAK